MGNVAKADCRRGVSSSRRNGDLGREREGESLTRGERRGEILCVGGVCRVVM